MPPQELNLPSEEEPVVNAVITEIPSRPFKLTMEVPFLIVFLASAMTSAVINNLILYRTCIHALNYDEETCSYLQSLGNSSNNSLESEVQKYANFVTMSKSVVESLIPAGLSLFIGVWSDTYGRKPLIVWSLLGMCLSSMSVVVYSVMGQLGPWWFLLTAVPYSLLGGTIATFTGAFCYISDITDTKNRSFRLALLETALFGGTILGAVVSPYAFSVMGTVWILFLDATLKVIAYAFTNIYVQESINGALDGGFTKIFDIQLAKDMFATCLKKRHNYKREIMMLLILANSLSVFILYGILGLDYYYVRKKLSWGLSDFSIYSATSMLTLIFGLIFGVSFLQKVFKLNDMVMAIVAFISSIVEMFIKAFATFTWHMYLATSISFLRGLSSPLIRSVLSKTIPIEDLSKVFAFMSALEGILPVISPLVYNSIYELTMISFPGAVYLLTAGFNGVSLALICIAQHYILKSSTSQYTVLVSG